MKSGSRSEHHHHKEHKGAVVHVHAKKRGGMVKDDERTKEMVHEEMEGKKHGGKVKGHAPKARVDRRARGGRMTPKSPFSGAGDVKRMSYEGKLTHVDEGGKGREPRP